jgi:hypothetical protein
MRYHINPILLRFYIKRISPKKFEDKTMKTNRDLLKEAIADAKAVKETAIANAKAALEEAFTPHLKELFASKLEEMELDEAEEVDEMMYDEMEEAKKEEKSEKSKMEEEMDLEELLAELNEAEEEEGEAEEKEEEGEAEEEAEGEEEVEVSEMSEEDLKTFIEDVIKDMVSAGELEAGEKEAEMGAEAGAEETGMMEEELDEEVNLEELLAEVEMEKVNEMMSPAEMAEIAKLATNMGLTPDQLKAILTALPAVVAGGAYAFSDIKDAAKKGVDAVKNLFKSKSTTAEAEIEELKQELQEVNLLNAKLLYTNKIFKAKNLTDPQKVKVLESFDKATTVNEVKLVFETLTESLNSNKTTVNESKVRGFASKTTAPVTNNTKQPIIESNDAFARMQRLAGLR